MGVFNMAFGITRGELEHWKKQVTQGEIAFLTHYWEDERFPACKTVTKVGCTHTEHLIEWGRKYGLQAEWLDLHDTYPHFDLFGVTQLRILRNEYKEDHIQRFNLEK